MLLKISSDTGKILQQYSLSDLNKKEVDLENWMANHLTILIKNLSVWKIGQETPSKREADIIALDEEGNTCIFELKRESADYRSIGQIFSYYADIATMDYTKLEEIAREHYDEKDLDLAARHYIEFNLSKPLDQNEFNSKSYLFVVAEKASDRLWNIIDFLRTRYNIPIGFIQFEVFNEDENILVYFDCLDAEKMIGEYDYPEEIDRDDKEVYFWYNTDNENEKVGNKHDEIFNLSVAATYGRIKYGEKLKRATIGDHVFAYANKEGIRAYGVVTGEWNCKEVEKDTKRVTSEHPEYHLPVEWKIVLSKKHAIKIDEIRQMGYQGFRGTFRRIRDREFIDRLLNRIRSRNSLN
ncbi:MAG: hypothetical protein GF329_08795 [Candidatus Lokiarchaeota archaeon]|nr:hypothetical protein [Candidatus Lokiarchaeota archaeon]